MQPELELVQQWLERADVDLRSAEVALGAGPPITEDACFHCQQAVEKLLKGFLTFHGIEFEWSHDIEYLLNLCAREDDSFEQWRTTATPLTAYATRVRYPHRGAPPTPEEAGEALTVARDVWRFVLDRLPREVHLHKNNGR